MPRKRSFLFLYLFFLPFILGAEVHPDTLIQQADDFLDQSAPLEALNLLAEIPDHWAPIQQIKAQQLRAYAQADLEQYGVCLQTLEQAFVTAQQHALIPMALELLRDQAKFRWKGEQTYEDAIDFLQKHIDGDWFRGLPSNSDKAKIFIDHAFLHRRIGKFAEEAYWYEQAIPLFSEEERSGQYFLYACFQAYQASIRLIDYERSEQYIQFVENYNQGKTYQDRVLYARTQLAYWNGDLVSAESYYQKAKKFLPKESPIHPMVDQYGVRIALDQEDLGKATTIANRILQSTKNEEPNVLYPQALLFLATIAQKRGEEGKAKDYLDEASQVEYLSALKPRDAASLMAQSAALCVERKEWKAVITYSQRGLVFFLPAFQADFHRAIPSPDLLTTESWLVDLSYYLGKGFYHTFLESGEVKDLEASVLAYENFWQAVEKLRAFYLTDGAKEYLGEYIYTWIEEAILATHTWYEQTGNPEALEKVFTYLQGSRAVTLADAYHRNQAFDQLGLDPQFLELERLYRRSLLLAEDELRLLNPAAQGEEEKDVEEYRNRYNLWLSLMKNVPALDRFLQNRETLSIPDYQKSLAPDEASFFYYWGENQVFLLTIQKDQAQLSLLGATKPLQESIEQWISYFAQPEQMANHLESWQNLGEALSTQLFPENKVDAAHWNIFPDGPLYSLPFEALVQNGEYLIQQKQIAYQDLLQRQEISWGDTVDQYVGFAPIFSASQRSLLPLKYSSLEMEALERYFHAASIFQNAEATRQLLAEVGPHARVLHLSTHAQANAALGQPGIEFFDASLALPAVYGLRLNKPLVLLSACESSLGAYQQGEGVMSLTRGFNYAGAAAVVSTLWSVNERSTAEIVQRFYQFWNKNKNSSEALRAAKLAYLEDPSIPEYLKTPYYWAGMVHWGQALDGQSSRRFSHYLWWILGSVVLLGLSVRLFRLKPQS